MSTTTHKLVYRLAHIHRFLPIKSKLMSVFFKVRSCIFVEVANNVRLVTDRKISHPVSGCGTFHTQLQPHFPHTNYPCVTVIKALDLYSNNSQDNHFCMKNHWDTYGKAGNEIWTFVSAAKDCAGGPEH